jgi:hypothetical protein
MGLDGTIKRADGQPLGSIGEVQQALADVFPGITFGMLPSGQQALEVLSKIGAVPDVIARHAKSRPAKYGAGYEGQSFSAEFDLGPDGIVRSINLVLRGATNIATPKLWLLEQRHGWITTHP